ncbi:Putative protein EFR3 [Septoria linicola]|uniref:Protein EFR3 n=1 Tax=Septoria linicola TaxID=215465 RepID=A0A9Q9AKL8_9PEZI|nr:putative protein EFR3 [Septoria linicola]USW47676.1 Putative protein EFR3 [Septoria linicola]
MPQVPGRPERLRPKHQNLVLKCYPRLPKNAAADVKPNNSELSYLLYYASTRQHKLPKVGSYLESKTTYDVGHSQSARVQITLQILTAILEHHTISRASGFALIAPSVLRIIREVVNNSTDIGLIEASLPTWDALCRHQDGASLAADHEYRDLYTQVVRLYGSLARNNTKKLGRSTQPVANHDALRLRKAGVAAITSIFAPAEQLERNWNREFDNSFASVLTNLRNSGKHDYIDYLQGMNREAEEKEGRDGKTLGRRQSITHNRTLSSYQEEQEPDPRTAEGTAQDADRIEEEEVGLLAVDCVKAIFATQNRGQTREATFSFMRYIAGEQGRSIDEWSAQLFRLITSWTPVQDRFVILFTAVETLRRLPVDGADFRLHETYAKMIHGVMSSELNLIGLSVMDVLIGLMTTTIRAVTYSSRPGNNSVIRDGIQVSNEQSAAMSTVEVLKACIACLAGHVYYSDQVTDMIAALLVRVKAYPSAADFKSNIFGETRSRSNTRATENTAARQRLGTSRGTKTSASNTSPARPSTAAAAITSATKDSIHDDKSEHERETSERSNSLRSGYFTTDEARKCAFDIVKSILQTAQSTKKQAHTNVVINRNRVPVGVWDGTQWLARLGSEDVRNAYKEAVTTWAQYESDEKDPNILDFEADDCFGKFVQKEKAASQRGSIGQSQQSHPQLLMLPNFGGERRLSSGNVSSSGLGLDNNGSIKPRVRAKDLEEIMEGKRQVELAAEINDGEQVDLRKLLAGIQVDEAPKSRVPLMAAPPY